MYCTTLSRKVPLLIYRYHKNAYKYPLAFYLPRKGNFCALHHLCSFTLGEVDDDNQLRTEGQELWLEFRGWKLRPIGCQLSTHPAATPD